MNCKVRFFLNLAMMLIVAVGLMGCGRQVATTKVTVNDECICQRADRTGSPIHRAECEKELARIHGETNALRPEPEGDFVYLRRIREQLADLSRDVIPFVGISQRVVSRTSGVADAEENGRERIAAFIETTVQAMFERSSETGSDGVDPIADYFRRGAGRQVINQVINGARTIGNPVENINASNSREVYVIMIVDIEAMRRMVIDSSDVADRLFEGRQRHQNRMDILDAEIERQRARR
jgi:hypothetical protein